MFFRRRKNKTTSSSFMERIQQRIKLHAESKKKLEEEYKAQEPAKKKRGPGIPKGSKKKKTLSTTPKKE